VNIERCLASVRECADEIVVVDTGSTDATPEIAEAMGARVIRKPWTGDFSAARNCSLEAAGGDWILFLDCDEELSPGSREELQRVLEDDKHEGFFVIVDNITEKGHELSVPSVRLFRNRPCFRFQGKIHEQIVTSILTHYDRNSLAQSNITIVHHGYHPHTTNIRAKANRNLAILLTYREEEKDGFYYYNLGTEYWRMGQREKALENYTRGLTLVDLRNPGQNFGPILVRRTITILMELGRYRAAIEAARHYQALLPDYNDLVFLEGACHLACGRYSQAASIFRRYLKMPPLDRKYPREQGFHGFSGETMLTWARDQARRGEVPNLTVCIAGGAPKTILARCIRSVQEIARELLYLDVGSPEGAGELAYQMGAAVLPLAAGQSWPAARETVVGKARGKWILWLWADEVLAPGGREEIARAVNRAINGIQLQVRTFLGPETTACHLHGERRLFRRHAPAAGACESAAATVDALRYTYPAPNAPPLPADPYEQGREFFYRRDFDRAVESLATVAAGDRPASWYFFYGSSLLESGRAAAALAVLDEGVEQYPDYTDLRYLRGTARLRLGREASAAADLAACLERGDASWTKYTVHPGTGTHRCLCSLGAMAAGRGDAGEALELYRRAAREPGGFEPALAGMAALVEHWPQAPATFLESHGLLNSVSLGILAGAMADAGRYEEGMECLSQAAKRLAREPAPRNLAAWRRAMDHLLDGLAREAGPAQ